jgi:hypothetical protein
MDGFISMASRGKQLGITMVLRAVNHRALDLMVLCTGQ